MNVIQQLEQEEMNRLGRKTPEFVAGDTVIVNVNVVEGERKRVQAYEGVVIAKRNRGINSSFIVRKISSGEGVERTFQTYSPSIASMLLRKSDTMRLYELHPADVRTLATHFGHERRTKGRKHTLASHWLATRE